MLRPLTPAYNVTSLVAAKFACNLLNLQGYNRGAEAWLHVLDTASLPADGAVPLKSFQMQATFPFSWKFDPSALPLKSGLVVAASTTEGTLTNTAAPSIDVLVDIEEYEVQPGATSVAGNIANEVDTLLVWAETGGAVHRLVSFRVIGSTITASTRYIMLFAKTAPSSSGEYPVLAWPIASGEDKTLHFGNSGRSMRSTEYPALVHEGCALYLSDTPGKLNWSDLGSGDMVKLQANYI